MSPYTDLSICPLIPIRIRRERVPGARRVIVTSLDYCKCLILADAVSMVIYRPRVGG